MGHLETNEILSPEHPVNSISVVKSDALDASDKTPGPNVRNDSNGAKIRSVLKKTKIELLAGTLGDSDNSPSPSTNNSISVVK